MSMADPAGFVEPAAMGAAGREGFAVAAGEPLFRLDGLSAGPGVTAGAALRTVDFVLLL